jgi:hypothetical protein
VSHMDDGVRRMKRNEDRLDQAHYMGQHDRDSKAVPLVTFHDAQAVNAPFLPLWW